MARDVWGREPMNWWLFAFCVVLLAVLIVLSLTFVQKSSYDPYGHNQGYHPKSAGVVVHDRA